VDSGQSGSFTGHRLWQTFLTGFDLSSYSAGMQANVPGKFEGRLSADSARHVRQALETAGCRFTQQRAAVFAYLEQIKSHPTADEVYHAVRHSIPRISLATVYKALEALVIAGLATKLGGGDGSARYDCCGEDHYHLRDIATGEVRDVPAPFDPHLLAKLDPRLVERLRQAGFSVTGYRLEVLGRFEGAVQETR
jgi:Fur family peroxide stress response transcriptional regulator